MKSVSAVSICRRIALFWFYWMALLVGSQTYRNCAFAFESSPLSLFPFQQIQRACLSKAKAHNVRREDSTSRRSIQPNLPFSHTQPPNRKSILATPLQSKFDSNDDDEEVYIPLRTENQDSSTNNNNNNKKNYLDDLTPPPVNFARNSILFSENPSTKSRNNVVLELWRFSRTHLPAVITGAWPWRNLEVLDERPLSALYNALLVRLPVLAVAISYLYQKIAMGHDLVMDLGFDANGPQVVPPVLVISVLVLILL